MRLTRKKKDRGGFTLVELLVVISIISILAALILPGVNAARRAALRAKCLNNVKNIGTAFQNYLSRRGTFPASGQWDATDFSGTTAAPAPQGATSQVADQIVADAWSPNMASGMDLSSSAGRLKHSWVLDLLPDLEAEAISTDWDFTAAGQFGSYLNTNSGKMAGRGNAYLADRQIAVFVCPVDSTAQPGRGNLSYVVNGGFVPHYAFTTNATSGGFTIAPHDITSASERRAGQNYFNMGLMFLDTYAQGGNTTVHKKHKPTIKDGTTNTILFSENINAGVHFNYGVDSNWACPHPFNTSFYVNGLAVGVQNIDGTPYDYSQAKNNSGDALPSPNVSAGQGGGINGDVTGTVEGFFPYPNSQHPGGVHIAMADSSASFVSETMDGRIWARLVTPQGSLIVDPSTGQPVVENDAGQGFKQLPDLGDFGAN